MIQSNNTFQVHEGLGKIFDRRFFPVRTCAFKLQHIHTWNRGRNIILWNVYYCRRGDTCKIGTPTPSPEWIVGHFTRLGYKEEESTFLPLRGL